MGGRWTSGTDNRRRADLSFPARVRLCFFFGTGWLESGEEEHNAI
jgi:hypothetical protein